MKRWARANFLAALAVAATVASGVGFPTAAQSEYLDEVASRVIHDVEQLRERPDYDAHLALGQAVTLTERYTYCFATVDWQGAASKWPEFAGYLTKGLSSNGGLAGIVAEGVRQLGSIRNSCQLVAQVLSHSLRSAVGDMTGSIS